MHWIQIWKWQKICKKISNHWCGRLLVVGKKKWCQTVSNKSKWKSIKTLLSYLLWKILWNFLYMLLYFVQEASSSNGNVLFTVTEKQCHGWRLVNLASQNVARTSPFWEAGHLWQLESRFFYQYHKRKLFSSQKKRGKYISLINSGSL